MLDANADDACVGVIAWMHTFSPAKMWITGLDQLRKPLLHLHTQANVALPWSEIDMDFMNLNQAAHGDREFGVRADPARPRPQDRRRSRERPRGHGSCRDVGAGGARACRAVDDAAGPLRRQHAQRRGDRGRQGRGRAAVGRVGQHLRRQRPRRGRRRGRRRRRSTSSSRSTPTPTTWRPSCWPGGERHESLRYGARIELGLRAFLTEGGFTRVHHELRGPRRAAPAARVSPCSG